MSNVLNAQENDQRGILISNVEHHLQCHEELKAVDNKTALEAYYVSSILEKSNFCFYGPKGTFSDL